MMRKTIVLLGTLSLLACTKDRAAEKAGETTTTGAATDAGVTVESVRLTLIERIPRAAEGLNTIDISNDNGIVTLRGKVEDDATKRDMLNAVRSMPNVKSVRDELLVAPKSPQPGSMQKGSMQEHGTLEGIKQGAAGAKQGAVEGTSAVTETAKQGANAAKQGAIEGTEAVTETAKQGANAAKQGANAAKQGATEGTEAVTETAKQGANAAKQGANAAKQGATEGTEAVTETAKQGANAAKQGATEGMKEGQVSATQPKTVNAVRTQLMQEKAAPADVLSQLKITDESGIIVLRGTVPDEATHAAVLKAAHDTPKLKGLRDELKIKAQ
jgi:trimeric autotransporter adhesin